MRTHKIALNGLIVFLGLTGVALMGTGCAGTNSSRSTGAYLDDKSIGTRVKTALFRDPVVSGFDVHVNTFRGDVQLSGFVDNPAQKDRAADIARSVKGVREVTNNLEIKPGAPTAVGAPGSTVQGSSAAVTQSAAPENPSGNAAVTPNTAAPGTPGSSQSPNTLPAFQSNVEISTANGRAILRGTVATEAEKRSVEKKVRDIPGIQSVDNELQVLAPR